MKALYILYQIFIALPILLVLTILTALVTIVGSWIGDPHVWGYYPGKIWSQLFCYVLLIPVKVVGHPEVLDKTSYVFVANHQGSFDIFLIYGFLGRNFKWMMKKSLRKMPFVGKACEAAGHIFVDKSGPKKVKETIEHARNVLQNGTLQDTWDILRKELSSWRMSYNCRSYRLLLSVHSMFSRVPEVSSHGIR